MLVSRIASGLDPGRFRSLTGLFEPGWLQSRCSNLGIPAIVMPMANQWDIGWVHRCCAVVRQEQVDVIHAHEFRANAFGAIVAKLCGIPLVATVHGKNYYPDRFKRRAAYRWVSKVARMVAVSEDLREFLSSHVGICSDRIIRIYNGVDVPEPQSLQQVVQFRARLGIKPEDFVIGIVGSLYPVKGHAYLFEAFQSIVSVRPNAKLLVVGQGHLEESLKRRVAELGIGRAVYFLGMRNDIPHLLAALDLFVLPSLSEGLSVALLEAMSVALPVVASGVGGNLEIVENGYTGLLVPPRNPAALVEGILEMMSNPEKTRLFGERGRQRIVGEFTAQHMLSRYEELYEESCQL